MKVDLWRQDLEINNMDQLLAVKRRVRGLLHPSILENQPIGKLIESAYVQGLMDAQEIFKLKGKQDD